MIKKIIKKGYVIEFTDTAGLKKEKINQIVDQAIEYMDKRAKKEQLDDVYIEDKITEEEIEKHVNSALALKKSYPQETIAHIIQQVLTEAGIGPANCSENDMRKIKRAIQKALKGAQQKDAAVKDIPVNSPEEEVTITYNEGLKGGKSPLTFGMIETAYKDRYKDGGLTFDTYIDVALESLRKDIEDAKYIVSGEMTPTRQLLLEDYIRIEHLLQKAGEKEKLAEMKALVDELSEKLDLNSWKKPKFKPQARKKYSQELRMKHRYDSHIQKKVKPIYLCTPTELKNSYVDAKQGKLPQVFEGNLRKVEKDMMADYERINQGRDNYLDDIRIVQLLPDIVQHYENATKWAEELGYDDYADRFQNMLRTIKKGWGLD